MSIKQKKNSGPNVSGPLLTSPLYSISLRAEVGEARRRERGREDSQRRGQPAPDRMSSSPSVATRALRCLGGARWSDVARQCSAWINLMVLLYQHRYENTRYNCIFKCSCIIVSPLPLD